MMRGTALGLALLGTGMLFVIPASGADDVSTRKHRIDGQLHAAAGDVAGADRAVVAANNKVLAVRAKLRPAQAAVVTARRQLATARSKYAVAKKAADAAQVRAEAARRAVDAATAYLNKVRSGVVSAARTAFVDAPEGQLNAVAHATDPTSLADSLGLLQQVMHDKTGVLQKARVAQEALAERSAELAQARAQAAAAQAAASAEVSRMSALLSAAQRAQAAVIALQKQEQHALEGARAAAAAAKSHYDALYAESSRLAAIMSARAAAAHYPSGRSGAGLIMPVRGVFSSPFGWRTDPISGARSFHPGQDIAAPLGTPIHAATSGVVTIAGWVSGYGNYTCINRSPSFATCYGHQSAILVRVGQSVSQGQHIGNVGSTGYSTGPHLHFEVRINGQVVNPLPYLP